jgi:hypothetical protein
MRPSASSMPPWLPWVAAAAVLAVIAAFLLLRPSPESGQAGALPDPPLAADAAAGDVDRALGPDVEPIELPPLGASDELVRSLVRGLSNHPRIAAWLTTDQLIRNFTVVVENIATGMSPARHLTVFRPGDPFEAAAQGGRLVVHPRSHARYATIASAVASIDPQGAARLYATLRPRIEEAHREQGHPEPFDRMLERAMLVLLHTPVPDADARLVARGGVYEYESSAFEQMSDVQKQFARMGPEHMRTVQAHLQAIALALGIPVERLSP